jgi:tRNA A-37 threonylcarbamoyl transferase component Bud32
MISQPDDDFELGLNITMIDIENKVALVEYLVKKNLLSGDCGVTMSSLSGGVSCKVVKVTQGSKELVVKQALPKLKVKEDWYSDIRRIVIERKGLAAYHQIVPESVPELIFFDDDHYLYVMEAAPNHAVPWKTKLLGGELNFRFAEQAALSLAKVHSESSRNKTLQETFKNQQFYVELRIEPYFRTIGDRHPTLHDSIDRTIAMLLENKLALVHGDFSPKNILITDKRIYILDFEVAHIGHPSFDLAFFTNHLLLKAIKNKHWLPAYMNLMCYFADCYLSGIDFMDPKKLEKDTVSVLAFLFLARVDGKSPAEYISDENDKALIRRLSYQMIDSCDTYVDVARLFMNELNCHFWRR